MPLSVPVGAQPFLKSSERPQAVVAGEALTPIVPVYFNSTSNKWFQADSDPADSAKFTNVRITIGMAETDSYVNVVSQKGTIIDFGGSLTSGDQYYLIGAGSMGTYAEIPSLDRIVELGSVNKDGDFIVNILDTGKFK